MPNITVKNIPEHTYKILKQTARTHHRSVNSEIIHLIEKSTISTPFQPEHHLSLARRSRENTRKFLLTEDILQRSKEDGRP